MMKIVIDLQSMQTPSMKRGIGRYSVTLTKEILKHAGPHQICLALNASFPNAIENCIKAFDGLISREDIVTWQSPYAPKFTFNRDHQNQHIAEAMRESFLAGLCPDIIHTTSLFEGFLNEAVTSIGAQEPQLTTSVTLYDLIPLLNKKEYLYAPIFKDWYYKKINYLKRANLYLSISEYAKQEAMEHLELPEDAIMNISSAIDPHFTPLKIDTQTEQTLRARYKLTKPFLMYTGGSDYRKNVDGLIRAFALLPCSLRKQYQVAMLYDITEGQLALQKKIMRKSGLNEEDIIFTRYVSETDLLTLYRMSHLFVFPSLHEGFGLPALEAMSCGIPTIGSNVSSIPEVIGRQDALFDPTKDASIAEKITEVLTRNDFYQTLKRHAQQQSKKFSWDITAKRSIEAFEAIHEKNIHNPPVYIKNPQRPKLAFVAPIPTAETNIPHFNQVLLSELKQFYDIECITDQSSHGATIEDIPIKDITSFKAHAQSYDRVFYHMGNTQQYAYIAELIQHYPGTVVLHDFFLGQAYTTNTLPKALYHAHGYCALYTYLNGDDPAGSLKRFPCNQQVLENANGVIIHSDTSMALGEKWYGNKTTKTWKHIPQDTNTTPRQIAKKYYEALESCYRGAETTQNRLLQTLATKPKTKFSERDWLALCEMITFNQYPMSYCKKQLLVDISHLSEDAIKQTLTKYLLNPSKGYRVEPIYATNENEYFYARKATLAFLGCSETLLEDKPIHVKPGDKFIKESTHTHFTQNYREYLINLGVVFHEATQPLPHPAPHPK